LWEPNEPKSGNKLNTWGRKLFGFFSSLKLAVFLILSLGTILAVGTFYEAEYGTPAAQRVIYKSWFVSLEMMLLILNLACAAMDRYPWKKHHVGFVITHAGIITLIMGSFITQQKGIDGNIALGVNEATDNFFVSDNELHIYQSIDGRPFALLVQTPVDFEGHPPGKKKYEYKLADDDVINVTQFIEKASRKIEVTEGSASGHDPNPLLPALRFKLYNDRVNVTEWIGLDKQLPPFFDLGPATVSFIQGPLPAVPTPRNQIVIYQPNPKSNLLKYAIYSSRQLKAVKEGTVDLKSQVPTGWMNLQFSVEEYFDHADPKVTYVEADPDAKETGPAIEVAIKDNHRWFELESPHEIKGPQNTYFVSYTRKKYELGFALLLKKFKMATYGGSTLPASYESTVGVDNKYQQVISMNEPLKYNGYTIYQSSFETNEKGEPILSIFSVNFDPGRPIKYAGALCIVGGISIMFYWKPKYTGKKANKGSA